MVPLWEFLGRFGLSHTTVNAADDNVPFDGVPDDALAVQDILDAAGWTEPGPAKFAVAARIRTRNCSPFANPCAFDHDSVVGAGEPPVDAAASTTLNETPAGTVTVTVCCAAAVFAMPMTRAMATANRVLHTQGLSAGAISA